MLTQEHFKAMKKMPVGKDENKSRKRITDDYKAASKEKKAEIESLSGLNKASFYKGVASLKVALAMAQVLNASPFYYSGDAAAKGKYSDKLADEFLEKYAKTPAETAKARSGRKPKGVQKDAKAAKAPKGKPRAGRPAADGIEEIASIPSIELAPAHIPFSDGIESMPEFPVYVEKSKPGRKTAQKPKSPAKPSAPSAPALRESKKAAALAARLDADSAAALLKALYIRAEVSEDAAKNLDIVKRHLLS
jgi:hypothetical protein